MFGDGMVAKAEYVKQGDLAGRKDGGWDINIQESAGQESECS